MAGIFTDTGIKYFTKIICDKITIKKHNDQNELLQNIKKTLKIHYDEKKKESEIFNKHYKVTRKNVVHAGINTKYNEITIIIYVRNDVYHLQELVKSLMQQTNEKWDCIIIDDNSAKKITHDDLLNCEKFYGKITIINLTTWTGIVKCYKIGIMRSKKNVVGFVNVSCVLVNNAIDMILNVYNTNKNNIFVYSNFYNCDNALNILHKSNMSEVKRTLLDQNNQFHFYTFNKKYYFLTQGYDDNLLFGGFEHDILWKLEIYCTPVFINDCLYYYRKNVPYSQKIHNYSYILAVLKNIYTRYKCLDFYVEADKLYCNDVYICEVTNQIINKEKICAYVEWNYKDNTFNVSNNATFNFNKFNCIHPNTYFDNIYIINMKKDVEKKKRIEYIFLKYGIQCEFIEAICGNDEPYFSQYTKNKYGLRTCGMYGYSLSMIKIFEDAKKKGYEKILVCDDDIIFHNDFLYHFDEKIRSIPVTWKVLFFGLTGPWVHGYNTYLWNVCFDKPYITNLNNCDGSFCVGYDKSMFDILIEITQKFSLPFDTQMIQYLNNNLSIEKYAFYPHLVMADTTKPSTIATYKEENNIAQNFERNHFKSMINIDNFELDTMSNNAYNELKVLEF